jgi:8-amino-7-oxononanoate synthase
MTPQQLPQALAEIERLGLYRQRRLFQHLAGAEIESAGRRLINFSSNDYLGLSRHPKVTEAFLGAASKYGVGSGASHLICGHGPAHHALEEELAAFVGRPRALLFSTGYMANLGVITALSGRGVGVFEDRLNHASLLDGALLSGARLKRYAHADGTDLSRQMDAASTAEGALVATDGVFSMDGDLAPLPDLAATAKERQAWLVVDDAHGLGVVGPTGRGVLELFGLGIEDVPVLVGTLGKAMGTFGAFVSGSADLIEYLIQRARTYIYTTALPPAVAEATRASLKICADEPWRRERLNQLIGRFRAGAATLGLRLMPSSTPIQPIVVGDNLDLLRANQALLDLGLQVGAVRPPTVPIGSARLRVTLSALHEDHDVDRLLDGLARTLTPAP